MIPGRMETVYGSLTALVRVQFARLAEAGGVLREVDCHMQTVQAASRSGSRTREFRSKRI